jgi:hypothetical protein
MVVFIVVFINLECFIIKSVTLNFSFHKYSQKIIESARIISQRKSNLYIKKIEGEE